MHKPLYYLTFRRRDAAADGRIEYGGQVTIFTERAPAGAYKTLKDMGVCVAYGREGEAPVRDSYPHEAWDCAGSRPSGAKR